MPERICKLSVGSPFPGALPLHDAAVLELFRDTVGGHLLVAISNLDDKEIKVLRKGELRVGILSRETAILLLWQFQDKRGRPLFTFDTSFDARRIPKEQLSLPSKCQPGERLQIPIVSVDRASGKVVGLRLISLPLSVSDSLLELVMEQLAAPEKQSAAEMVVKAWMENPLERICAMTTLERAGT